MGWQRLDGVDQRRADSGSSMPIGKMDQHQVASAAFDQCGDGGTGVAANDEVSLPVPGDDSVSDFCGPLADHDHRAGNRFLRRAEWR